MYEYIKFVGERSKLKNILKFHYIRIAYKSTRIVFEDLELKKINDMEFLNSRYFTRQQFEIKKSSLKIERKNIFDAIEFEIPFDLIHNKIKIQTVINNNLIFTGLFILFIGALFWLGSNDELMVILLSVGFLLIVMAFLGRKKIITIFTMEENGIELFFNEKNKNEVVEYSLKIIDASNNYLLKKYSKVDRSLPIESQLDNYQFLLNREIISDEDFEVLKNQLLGTENKTSIGFAQVK